MNIPYHRHNLGREELAELADTISGLFITTGSKTARFEEQFARALEYQNAMAVGVTSATAALHLALLALGVKPLDDVITTPLSFVATANAILYTGARPVFVDVEKDTGNINADLISKAITKRTKAILPVHLYGQMCDMEQIRSIAKRHGLKVIEDSAHCIEGSRDGIRPGQLGDAACFSFHAIKTLTSGEGGAIVVRDPGIERILRQLRAHGIGQGALERRRKNVAKDMLRLGWKYNMSDIQASLLLPQIPLLKKRLKIREHIAKRFGNALLRGGIAMPKLLKGVKSSHSVFTIWVNPYERDAVMGRIRNAGVEALVVFQPIHLTSYYRKLGYGKGMFPAAERIGASNVALPIYPKLTANEINTITRAVLDAAAGS